jgi:hypothetical protein
MQQQQQQQEQQQQQLQERQQREWHRGCSSTFIACWCSACTSAAAACLGDL